MNKTLLWATVIAALATIAVPVIALSFKVWFYLDHTFELDKRWYEDDVRWNREIIARQERIEKELSYLRGRIEQE